MPPKKKAGAETEALTLGADTQSWHDARAKAWHASDLRARLLAGSAGVNCGTDWNSFVLKLAKKTMEITGEALDEARLAGAQGLDAPLARDGACRAVFLPGAVLERIRDPATVAFDVLRENAYLFFEYTMPLLRGAGVDFENVLYEYYRPCMYARCCASTLIHDHEARLSVELFELLYEAMMHWRREWGKYQKIYHLGRAAAATGKNKARLTPEVRSRLLKEIAAGELSGTALAKKYEVSTAYVSKLRNNKSIN